MTKKINKKGFTLAEALIAMVLVAIMAAGIITALMATKRSMVSPSNREDMMFAIERASSLLQSGQAMCGITGDDRLAPTPNCSLDNPNNLDCHNINCLMPRICDTNNGDYFVYSVREMPSSNIDTQNKRFVNFKIRCEGQTI